MPKKFKTALLVLAPLALMPFYQNFGSKGEPESNYIKKSRTQFPPIAALSKKPTFQRELHTPKVEFRKKSSFPSSVSNSFDSVVLTKEDVSKFIRKNSRLFKRCYDTAYKKAPDLVGKVIINFDLKKGGAIDNTQIKSNIDDLKTQNCLKYRVMSLNFPDPQQEVLENINYSFVFSSDGSRE